MKPQLLAILVAIQLIALSSAQDRTSGTTQSEPGQPAELTPAYPREQRLNMNVNAGATSGTLRRAPGQAPRPILDSLVRWREFDEKLVQSSRHYAENTTRRNELMKSIAQSKDRASSGMDPASIIARREVERLLEDLHAVIEADKRNDEQTVRMLRQAITNRERWTTPLSKILDVSLAGKSLPAAERDRLRRWREGIARLKQNDSRDFIKQIVGSEYGDYLVNSNPMLLRMNREGEGASAGMRDGEGRGFWMGRITQLERTQAMLRQQIDHQDQEIARLKLMLQNRNRERVENTRAERPAAEQPAQK